MDVIASLRERAGNPYVGTVARKCQPQISSVVVSRFFKGEVPSDCFRFTTIMEALGADERTIGQTWRDLHPEIVGGDDVVALSPIMGTTGVGRLLGVSAKTTTLWDMPKPDRVEDRHYMWFTTIVVAWAVDAGRLPSDHGLVVPPPTLLWSHSDIATNYGVTVATVRHWRQMYTTAVRSSQVPDDRALPPETWNVDGVPLWEPLLILSWGDLLSKRCADGDLPEAITVPRQRFLLENRPDLVLKRLSHGETFDRDGIAALFMVKPATVGQWRAQAKRGEVTGARFPEPDAGWTPGGVETWERSTVLGWGETVGRIKDGELVKFRKNQGGSP